MIKRGQVSFLNKIACPLLFYFQLKNFNLLRRIKAELDFSFFVSILLK